MKRKPQALVYLKRRLKKAIPKDLKKYVSLCSGLGYCDRCGKKAPVYLERATKKSFCTECHPLRAEYYTHKYNEMWEIARMALFYWEDGFR
jgi:hypothetical protein